MQTSFSALNLLLCPLFGVERIHLGLPLMVLGGNSQLCSGDHVVRDSKLPTRKVCTYPLTVSLAPRLSNIFQTLCINY